MFDSEADERRFLLTAIVLTALCFGFVAGMQFETAITGGDVELAVLVATGAGLFTTLVAWADRAGTAEA